MANPPVRDAIAHVADGFRVLLGRSTADQAREAGDLTFEMTDEELWLIPDACEALATAARRRLAERRRVPR